MYVYGVCVCVCVFCMHVLYIVYMCACVPVGEMKMGEKEMVYWILGSSMNRGDLVTISWVTWLFQIPVELYYKISHYIVTTKACMASLNQLLYRKLILRKLTPKPSLQI